MTELLSLCTFAQYQKGLCASEEIAMCCVEMMIDKEGELDSAGITYVGHFLYCSLLKST